MKDIELLIGAGKGILELIYRVLDADQGVQIGTLVAAPARLAGSSLLRSFGILPEDLEPGTVLLSDQANEKGPELQGFLIWALSGFGIEIDQEKVVIETPPELKPSLGLAETLETFQEDFYRIARDHSLDYEDAAFAAAFAAAAVISETREAADPHLTVSIAVYGLIEGMKTVPPKLVAKNGEV